MPESARTGEEERWKRKGKSRQAVVPGQQQGRCADLQIVSAVVCFVLQQDCCMLYYAECFTLSEPY